MADPKYDEMTMGLLLRDRLPFTEDSTRVKNIPAKDLPPTTAGISGLLMREMPYLAGTNTRGFVLESPYVKDQTKNQGLQANMFLRPNADNMTIGHEAEHLLARQNTGSTTGAREHFEKLLGSPGEARDSVYSFLDGLTKSLPYLEEKYGISNGYMDPDFIKKQGRVGMYEILATLAGAESSLGVDLTKDPELRKTMFKDRNVREAYNAVTGLRQTRLDPRDLPPYTRQEEPPEPGLMGKLKRLMGYANGGAIEHAGNKKLI